MQIRLLIITGFLLLKMGLPIQAQKSAEQERTTKIALLKYKGGGDWYADPTALPNLIAFCNNQLHTSLHGQHATVEPSSSQLFDYPLVHMTGHGNVLFTEQDAENLRLYLQAGGFLHIDDNYGMDPFVRREMKKVFPDKKWQALPASHALFQRPYAFADGLPKIHEHDNKPPQAFALFHNNRMVVLYTYESDISDGWEDPAVHNNPPEKRAQALKMGANIINYCFTH